MRYPPRSSAAATATIEGKLSKGLRKFLKKVYVEDVHDQLAVADAKLGVAIKVHVCSLYLLLLLFLLLFYYLHRKNSKLVVFTVQRYPS